MVFPVQLIDANVVTDLIGLHMHYGTKPHTNDFGSEP